MADRLALIIANSDFNDPKLCRLKTPGRDAEALAEVLGDSDIGDFDVTLLVDAEEREIRRKIARLYHRRKRSDLLLLYYSGHGIRDAHGDLYLATRDTEMDIAGATALSASFVREQLDKSASQRKVVVLDCCHSGAFAKAGLGDSVGTEDAFAGSGYGRVILTASDALELSWEGDEKPTSDLCNFGKNENGTTPVATYSPQGDSPYGLVDMAGNVWELALCIDGRPGLSVLRGGSWDDDPYILCSSGKRLLFGPEVKNDIGFRCARGRNVTRILRLLWRIFVS